MADIKELKEVLDAVDSITFTILDAAKDGFQFTDISTLLPVFQKAKDALDGIKTVGEEVKDLDLNETKELVQWGVGFAFGLLEKIKELTKKEEPSQ